MFGKHAIADIPGLIEGASQGVGLGIKFLKHIEKTKTLVHCIDITIDDPIAAYDTVRKEFKEYNEALLEKPEIIFLNKTDLVDEDAINIAIKKFKPLKRTYSQDLYKTKKVFMTSKLFSLTYSPMDPKNYFVYILRTSGNTLYVGQTSNLRVRLQEHKSKKITRS